jgi:hypothetical protein
MVAKTGLIRLHNPSRMTENEHQPTPFPTLLTIPAPEQLLQSPPYWIIVQQESRARVIVQSSGAGSLDLLEAYLRRWAKGDARMHNRVSYRVGSYFRL